MMRVLEVYRFARPHTAQTDLQVLPEKTGIYIPRVVSKGTCTISGDEIRRMSLHPENTGAKRLLGRVGRPGLVGRRERERESWKERSRHGEDGLPEVGRFLTFILAKFNKPNA
jgi:hypothetical protein